MVVLVFPLELVALIDIKGLVEFEMLVILVAVAFTAVVFVGGATGGAALVQLARITATPILAGSPAAPSSATRGWGVVLFSINRETAFRAIVITSDKLARIDGEGGEVGGGRDVLEKTE